MALKPQILTHPNIPKPLHGLSPRELLGQEWWDIERRAAYAENDYKCWACGVEKDVGEWQKPWLEAHENYKIDYDNALVTVGEITALCHCCHNFIHSGRMQALLAAGLYPREKAQYILERGFRILRHNKLTPFFGTALFYATEFNEKAMPKAMELASEFEKKYRVPEWTEWRIVIGGTTYYSRFEDEEAWAAFYAKKNEEMD